MNGIARLPAGKAVRSAVLGVVVVAAAAAGGYWWLNRTGGEQLGNV